MRVWWGEFPLETDQAGLWSVGPMTLWLRRQSREWQVAYASANDPLAELVSVQVPNESELPPEGTSCKRYPLGKTGEALRLTPRLADRPVVSQPATALYLLPGEAISIIVSSPVWVVVEEAARGVLQEMPVFRPSDTWYGPATEEGGLSYAATTLAHVHFGLVPYSPFRAITPVTLRNNASDILPVDRINLPVPYLSLYEGKDAWLWTSPVSFDRHDGHEDQAAMSIGKTLPDEAGRCRLLSAPRKNPDQNQVIRTFSRIFN